MPKKHPQEIKDKALELWKSGRELEEISKELEIDFEVVKKWHYRYEWANERKEQKKKNARKLSEKIAKKDAEDKFNVREEFKKIYKEIKEKDLPKYKKPIEQIAARNQQRAFLREIGLIDQLYVEKSESNVNVNVRPILGGISKRTDIRRNNRTKKDRKS